MAIRVKMRIQVHIHVGLEVHKEDAHGRRPEANPLFISWVGKHDQGDVALIFHVPCSCHILEENIDLENIMRRVRIAYVLRGTYMSYRSE